MKIIYVVDSADSRFLRRRGKDGKVLFTENKPNDWDESYFSSETLEHSLECGSNKITLEEARKKFPKAFPLKKNGVNVKG